MDNLTHSLVGLALGELLASDRIPPDGGSLNRGSLERRSPDRGSPDRGSPGTASADRLPRRLLLAAGVIASNAPDLDLLYTGVTPWPLGYLLHHRGHTHTIGGLVALGLLLALVCHALPAVRRLPLRGRLWLWGLIAASLAGHMLMDACNTYGVHPWHPIDARWFFGDALFIFEPSLWLVLGVAAALNARRRLTRAAFASLVVLLPLALTPVGVISVRALAGLAAAGAAFAWTVRHASPRARSTIALGASAAFVTVMFALSGLARAATRDALAGDASVRGRIVDIALSPNPASPACWSVIAVEKDEPGGEFAVRRGTLSLLPAWRPPTQCASYRLVGLRASRWSGGGRVVWSDELRGPLARLRELHQQDCWVAAWLQFGRAPVFLDGSIRDLRFENGARGNFSAMSLLTGAAHASCPAHVTHWAAPRADLLTTGP